MAIDWAALEREIAAAGHGGKSAVIQHYADLLGVSRSTMYRKMKRRNGSTKSSPRTPVKYTDDIVDEAAKTILRLQENIKGITNRRISTEAAIEQMVERGIVEEGYLSVSGLNGALRKRGFGDKKARVRVEASYYAENYQIDFSRSELFQVVKKDEDGDWVLRVTPDTMAYKEAGTSFRLWITCMLDEYSRLTVVRYYPASGESSLLGIDFLNWFFNREEDDHFMRHKPDAMRSDNGPFMSSKVAIRALEALDIDRGTSTAGNKETNGKVERAIGVLKQGFETRLADSLVAEYGEKATIKLSDLNERVHAYYVRQQLRPHPVKTNTSRYQLALQSAQERQPELIDYNLRRLALRTHERLVDITCQVKIDNDLYEAPERAIGKNILIHQNINDEFVGRIIDGHDQTPFTLLPYDNAVLGKFNKARKKTYSEFIKDEINKEPKVVRPMAIEARKAGVKNVFDEATSDKRDYRSTALRGIDAKVHLQNELAKTGLYESPKTQVPPVVQEMSAAGMVYDGITVGEIDDLVKDIVSRVHKKTGS